MLYKNIITAGGGGSETGGVVLLPVHLQHGLRRPRQGSEGSVASGMDTEMHGVVAAEKSEEDVRERKSERNSAQAKIAGWPKSRAVTRRGPFTLCCALRVQ